MLKVVEVYLTLCRYISSPHLGAQLIDINQATLDLAVRCIDYLCQRHHDSTLSSEECSQKVLTGQYSFHSFSTREWFELLCQYLRSTKGVDPGGPAVNLVESIRMMWECRKIQGLQTTSDFLSKDESGWESQTDSEEEVIFKGLKEKQPLLHQVLCRVFRFRNLSFLSTGKSNQGNIEPFEPTEPLEVRFTNLRLLLPRSSQR